jgi:hypothetical protein
MELDNVKRSAKEVASSVPLKAPVAVKLADSEVISADLRGATLYGFWLGIKANPKVHKAVLSDDDGWHWIAHVVDVRSDDLVYDLHLAIIENIYVAPEKVDNERAS